MITSPLSKMAGVWLVALAALVPGIFVEFKPTSAHPHTDSFLTGDLETWDRIFSSRSPQLFLDGPSNNITWTEGPLIVGNELLFSDTVEAKIFSLNIHSGDLKTLKERSGDAPPEDDYWRAEPGSNGLALLDTQIKNEILVCQHGARRLVILDLSSGEIQPLATEYNSKRLNGPNDLVVRTEEVKSGGEILNLKTHVYFTDPVYAWLEKDRFADLPYLDEKVQNEGPGFTGVYRVEIDIADGTREGNVELITSDMVRPNGIDFDGDDLIVSECCQNDHLDGCTSGISRWEIFQQPVGSNPISSDSFSNSATIEDNVAQENETGGCADGFALYSFDHKRKDGKEKIKKRSKKGRKSSKKEEKKGDKKNVLIASCYGGLCVVDLEEGKVIARMWTAKKEFGGCRISNAVVGSNYVYLTGSCGIFTLPLQNK